jgi:hypothetical protein
VLGFAIVGCSSSSATSANGTDASDETSSTDGEAQPDASTDGSPSGDAPGTGLPVDAGADAEAQADVTCDGGIDAGTSPCRFAPASDGGLSSFVDKNDSCTGVPAGGGTGALIQFVGTDGQGNQLNLTFRTTTALAVEQTGTFQASLVIDEFGDGSSQSWSTPGNDCTLVIASDVCAPTFLEANQVLLTGSGMCAQPAHSVPPGVAPAIDVGAFTFTGRVQ